MTLPVRLEDQVLAVRAHARRLARHAKTLRGVGPERAARAAVDACALLGDAQSTLGRALRHELVKRTGLSAPMIAWGLETALCAWEPDEALALLADAPRAEHAAPSLGALVLAGNVFTAPLRAVLLPLVAGVPVLAKGASADDVLARYLAKALREVDDVVGAGCEVVTFSRGIEPLEAALLGHADLVTVYGDDETVAEVRARVEPRAAVVAHGHGLGAAFVSVDALADAAAAQEVAARVALDVAAYDQRGCLSPHAVVAEEGSAITPERFAAMLAEALDEIAVRLPRGDLHAGAAAEQMQWRGVAAARGALHEVDGGAVSFEGHEALRPSPGYRNVGVYASAASGDVAGRLAPFAHHLKALGVGGGDAPRARVEGLAPYVCEVGAMQTPPLRARLDGLHPFEGLVASSRPR